MHVNNECYSLYSHVTFQEACLCAGGVKLAGVRLVKMQSWLLLFVKIAPGYSETWSLISGSSAESSSKKSGIFSENCLSAPASGSHLRSISWGGRLKTWPVYTFCLVGAFFSVDFLCCCQHFCGQWTQAVFCVKTLCLVDMYLYFKSRRSNNHETVYY